MRREWAILAAAAPVAAASLAVFGSISSGAPDRLHRGTVATRRSPSPTSSPVRLRGGSPAHVAVIVMENEGYSSVVNSSHAPFIAALTQRDAVATEMYATRHPSLPNYLALIAGSTFRIGSDCTGCKVTASSLATQLKGARISWKAYMEGLPRACFTGAAAGQYAKKHDPFVYFTAVVDHPGLCSHVVPLGGLATDEQHGRLPRFIWITPDLCHDMHDCSVATGDRFLAGLVPRLLTALGHNGLLFLTWDEGSTDSGCCRTARGGHIATLVLGQGARPGARLTIPADQYSLLQTIEDVLGLPRLRWAACSCTPSLKPLLRAR